MRKKKTPGQIVSELLKLIIALLLTIVCLYPFWHVIMYSFSDSKEAMSGGLFVLPKGFSLESWKMLLKTKQVFIAFGNSIAKTVVGTLISVVISILTAYPLSLPYVKGRKFLQGMIFFTMLFSGGTIPTYILLKDLHMLDTFWAYVIPSAMNVYNMFILRNFFQAIPDSLSESAMLDGANHVQILTRIVLPLSKAALATQVMFYGVNRWNSYMDGVLYVNDSKLQLLQVYLRQIINSIGGKQGIGASAGDLSGASAITEESIKMTVIAMSVIPVLIVYLSLQKYFVKGTMVGSVKG
ncbi:MAG: carbohydrate ABC transporter permease [Lachnospiraceae bacterium]|nr:carbohydrate ABC transporter permease [Lachnospiraceae bacterium]